MEKTISRLSSPISDLTTNLWTFLSFEPCPTFFSTSHCPWDWMLWSLYLAIASYICILWLPTQQLLKPYLEQPYKHGFLGAGSVMEKTPEELTYLHTHSAFHYRLFSDKSFVPFIKSFTQIYSNKVRQYVVFVPQPLCNILSFSCSPKYSKPVSSNSDGKITWIKQCTFQNWRVNIFKLGYGYSLNVSPKALVLHIEFSN